MVNEALENAKVEALAEQLIAAQGGSGEQAILERDSDQTVFTDSINADKTPLYSTVDGRQIWVLNGMLTSVLKRKVPRVPTIAREHWGKQAWSPTPLPEDQKPPRLNLKCILHPEGEEREWLDSIGLAGFICQKANIPTEVSRRTHLRTRHKEAAAAITRAEEVAANKQKDDAMERQASAMERLAAELIKQNKEK